MGKKHDGKYLEMPPSVNARQVLETVSFIRAAYIRKALNELADHRYEKVETRLESAMERMQGFIEEIKDVIDRQSSDTNG